MRTFGVTGLTEIAFTCTRRCRPCGIGFSISMSIRLLPGATMLYYAHA